VGSDGNVLQDFDDSQTWTFLMGIWKSKGKHTLRIHRSEDNFRYVNFYADGKIMM